MAQSMCSCPHIHLRESRIPCTTRPRSRTTIDHTSGRSQFVTRQIAASALPPIPPDVNTAVDAQTEVGPLPTDDTLSSCGKFYVRMFRGEDIHVVANIQAEGFHTPLKFGILDDLAKKIFKAEVLEALRNKMQACPTNTLAILVAVPVDEGPDGAPVGVIEVFLSAESYILDYFPKDSFSPLTSLRNVGYGWLSSMAVSTSKQRSGCATALLDTAHLVVDRWNFGWTALHVYEDNVAALHIYTKAGYKKVGIDPIWRVWLGGKRRILMIREQSVT